MGRACRAQFLFLFFILRGGRGKGVVLFSYSNSYFARVLRMEVCYKTMIIFLYYNIGRQLDKTEFFPVSRFKAFPFAVTI